MPNAIWMDPGSSATYDIKFSSAITAPAPTSDSVTTFFGSRTYQCTTTSLGAVANVERTFTAGASRSLKLTGRAVFRLRLTNYPLNPSGLFYTAFGDGSTHKEHFLLGCTHTGVLRLFDGNSTTVGTQLGSDGSTLSLNTTYRISLAWSITNTTTFTIKWWINNDTADPTTAATLDGTVTTGTLGQAATTSRNEMYYGWTTSNGVDFSNPHVCNVGHLYIDDGSSLDDLGDIRVTPKRPIANNTNNFDTAIGANPANRWTNVNERPLSETNGWQQAGSSQVQENYTLESASAGDDDISAKTVVARMAWMWAKTGAIATTAKIMDNGTETAVSTTTTSTLYTIITTSGTYPSNAAGIGILSTGTGDDTFLYECGTVIAYSPSTATSAAITESATSSEAEDAAVSFGGTQAESATASAVQDSISEYLLDRTETATAVDSPTAGADIIAAVSESATASEVQTDSSAYSDSLESTTATDSVSVLVDWVVAISETVAGSSGEDATVIANIVLSVAEDAFASEVVDASVIFVAAVSEAATATDTADGGYQRAGAVAESTSPSDAWAAEFIAPFQAIEDYRPLRLDEAEA